MVVKLRICEEVGENRNKNVKTDMWPQITRHNHKMDLCNRFAIDCIGDILSKKADYIYLGMWNINQKRIR